MQPRWLATGRRNIRRISNGGSRIRSPTSWSSRATTARSPEPIIFVIAAHGNSLRALITVLEKLSPEGILKRELGTGVPIIYRLNADSTVASKLDLAS